MRLMNQWRFHRGKWSGVDYRWPEDSNGNEEELEALGFHLVCRLATESTHDYGLEAFVYERLTPKTARFGDAQYLVQLIVASTVHYVYLPDFPDFVEVMAKIEPVVRGSLWTEQLILVQDCRELLQRELQEMDRIENTSAWYPAPGEKMPVDAEVSGWLGEHLGVTQ